MEISIRFFAFRWRKFEKIVNNIHILVLFRTLAMNFLFKDAIKKNNFEYLARFEIAWKVA